MGAYFFLLNLITRNNIRFHSIKNELHFNEILAKPIFIHLN